MKLNQVSDEFRRLRVQEIVEESLLAEKEAQIQRLIHNNAYLETELYRIEDDKERIKNIYQEEVEKFQKTVDEFEEILKKEAQEKHKLEEEKDKLAKRLEEMNNPEGEVNQQRENQFNQSVQGYQNEIKDLKQEIESFKTKYGQAEYLSAKKEENIDELKKEIKLLKEENINLNGSYNSLIEEYNLLKELLDKVQEGGTFGEEEIKILKQKLEKSENELRKVNNLLQNAMAEKTELISKSDYITTQAKQVSLQMIFLLNQIRLWKRKRKREWKQLTIFKTNIFQRKESIRKESMNLKLSIKTLFEKLNI